MAISEFEIKKIEKAFMRFMAEHRPPPSLRHELDLEYVLTGQSVEICEVRPAFQAPGQISRSPIAKATYVKTQKRWKIYWCRADLKWHSYDPAPQARSIEDVLAIISEDQHCCFFG